MSFDQIDLSWAAPTSTGGSVLSYSIELSATGNSSWATILTGITETSYQHTDLSPGKTKFYRIYAINAAGRGESSNVASATTDAIAPNPPTDPSAQAMSNSQVALSWTAPFYDGGSSITGYMIEASATGHANSWETMVEDTKSTTLSYQHESLGVGTTYYYRISAINSEGTGAPSEAVEATTLGDPVAGPLGVADGQQLSLYPNPASDKVHITLPTQGVYVVTLHTLAGEVVLQAQLQGLGTQTIDLK